MSEHEIESRVATLEERARAQGELNHQFATKLDAIAAGVAQLVTASALTTARACPAPGKCLELAAELERLNDETEGLCARLGLIEETAAEARGGWKVLVFIAGVAGAAGSVIGWLASHWTGKGGGPGH